MIAAWYGIAGFMLIVYVVLDGRNFGAGMLHWLVARTPEERRQVIAAIGPLWSWHEVWLVGFGGTLLAVFPKLLASAFAGLLPRALSHFVVFDLARNLAGSRRPHQRPHVAGVLGFRLRTRQYASGHPVRRGGGQSGPRCSACFRRHILHGFLHRFHATRPRGTARLVHGIGCDLRRRHPGGARRDLPHAENGRTGA